jgi:hypothetical protein
LITESPNQPQDHRWWPWIFSLSAVFLLFLGVVIAAATFLALAAMAPEITAWPLPVTLFLGLVIGIAGIIVADRKPRRPVPLIISAVAATLHGLALVGIGAFVLNIILTSIEQRFVIPDGYTGEIVLIYDMADGVPEKRSAPQTIIYDIPASGLLATRGQPVRSWQRNRYFYRKSDGSLTEIYGQWYTTIHDTPENRSDQSIGIYLVGGIGQSLGNGCSYEFSSFLVGTKGSMLGMRTRKNISERMQEAGVSCRHAS